ncbi:DMT family transporter [Paenibacillus sp. NFR01]|uniref:DMT family transporter n=1 Tax=Paenibacillus sp. NFR01 TaxID=1566279 RepID=UPI0008C9D6B6|nr:DMT family transporter [Paenibacillus sp. NFR01]SET54882.1 EamA domain-containing membrane protein RarD [Paenibacillus sp. NFR01]
MSNVIKSTASKPAVRVAPMRSGFWLVVLGAALWGVDPLFRIILLKSLTSSQIVLLEHLVLFVAAAPVLWRHRAELKGIRMKQLGAILAVAWGGSAIATILFTKALTGGDLNSVLLLQKLQPLFAIGLAAVVLKERLPRNFGYLLVLALGGTYLLTFGWTLPFGNVHGFVGKSSLYALGAAALWGGSTVMGRYLLGSMKYETVTSLRFVVALPLLIVITVNEGNPWQIHGGAGTGALIAVNLLLQALLPGLLSMLLYYKGLNTTKASYATLAELSFPMVGVLINWIVYQQLVTLPQIIGFAFIWTALYLISSQESRQASL